jgi:hypothetical protein
MPRFPRCYPPIPSLTDPTDPGLAGPSARQDDGGMYGITYITWADRDGLERGKVEDV